MLGQGFARCAVRKDAGDDIDATDGALVCAEVRLGGEEIVVDGGEGVGRVTRAASSSRWARQPSTASRG